MMKELPALLEYLDKSPQVAELTLITNATLINEDWMNTFRKTPKLANIKLSIDGASEEVNGRIRRPGTLSDAQKAIGLIQKDPAFKIIVMFTLMKSNLKEIAHIFDLCRKEKLDSLIIERFIPQGAGAKIKEEVLDKKDWQDAVELITDFCSLAVDERAILPYKAFWVKFHEDEPLKLYGATCNVADDSLCIMPDGSVYPCRRFNKPIGNLLESPLKSIWDNAPLLKEVRKRKCLKGKCGSCDIECYGCRALAYSLTGDYLAEDSQCWYINKRQHPTQLVKA